MKFLSSDQVLAAHAALLELYGGEEGSGHRGTEYEGVDAAIQAVKNSYYDNVMELAAAHAVYIVQGHVFMDGNKRTGAAVMLAFLAMNGGKTRLSNKGVIDAMLTIQKRAESGERTDSLIRWLVGRLESRPKRRSRTP